MKIVIISRLMYPALAPRALRATELAKYFAAKGHDVTVYAVLGNYDYTEFQQKYRLKIKNLGNCHFATLNSSAPSKPGILSRILKRLLGRLIEFPDIELAFKMKRILDRESSADMLISVAIPYPLHWGIAWYRRKSTNRFPRVWVSDCGDPYMGNSIGHHPGYFQKVEDMWVEQTDYITIPIESAREAYSSAAQSKIRIIPQAFNFSETPVVKYQGNPVPTFGYAGNCYPGYRDPRRLLDYLAKLKKPFRFVVFTRSQALFEPYKQILGDKLEINGFIDRAELIKQLSSFDFLVNIKNASTLQAPSKLIDYGISGRPIISVGSDFAESEAFMQFMEGDYTAAETIDLSQYDIENVGNAFLKLASKK